MIGRMNVETRAVALRLTGEIGRSRGRLFADTLRARVWHIAQQGFNAVVLNCFSDGLCLFPSESAVASRLVKQHPQFGRGDAFGLLIEEIGAAGLVLYAEIDALSLGLPDALGVRYIARKHPAWLMRNREHDASPIGDDAENLYLCPSHPEVRRLFGDMVNELAEQYPVAGIVVRFRRLPQETASVDGAFCFCKACGKSIHGELNIDLDILEIAESSPAYKRWQEWSEEQFHEFLVYLKMRFRKVRCGAPLFSLAPRGALHEVQNCIYGRVLRRALTERLLDGIFTADYSGDAEEFHRELGEDCVLLGNTVLLLPALSARESGAIERCASVARQHPVPGFLCSELAGEQEAAEDARVFRDSALVAEVAPEAAVMQLSREIIDRVGAESGIGGFLRDMNTLLAEAQKGGLGDESDSDESPGAMAEESARDLTVEKIESLVENLLSIEQKISDGSLNVPGDVSRILRNLTLIQRLLWLFPLAER